MPIAKQNECIPYYTPGDAISAYVTTAVTGKRFVKISGNRQAGPALNTSTTGGNVSVNHATAAQRIFGAVHDVLQSPAALAHVLIICVPARRWPRPAGSGRPLVVAAAGVGGRSARAVRPRFHRLRPAVAVVD